MPVRRVSIVECRISLSMNISSLLISKRGVSATNEQHQRSNLRTSSLRTYLRYSIWLKLRSSGPHPLRERSATNKVSATWALLPPIEHPDASFPYTRSSSSDPIGCTEQVVLGSDAQCATPPSQGPGQLTDGVLPLGIPGTGDTGDSGSDLWW